MHIIIAIVVFSNIVLFAKTQTTDIADCERCTEGDTEPPPKGTTTYAPNTDAPTSLVEHKLEYFLSLERVFHLIEMAAGIFYQFEQSKWSCGAFFDATQKTIRIKGQVIHSSKKDSDGTYIKPIHGGNFEGDYTSGYPLGPPGYYPKGYFQRGVAGEFPAAGKAVTLYTSFSPDTGTPVPTITLANAQDDAHGRPLPLMKVKMGEPGTGFACTMHHDVTLATYCNGKRMEGFPDPQFEQGGISSSNDITSIVDNNQITTVAKGGSLFIARSDGSYTYGIFPMFSGWLLFEADMSRALDGRIRRYTRPEPMRKKRDGSYLHTYPPMTGIYESAMVSHILHEVSEPAFEVALGMCSIDANPEITEGSEGTGLTGPDITRVESREKLLEVYETIDDGDHTGAAYDREAVVPDISDSEEPDDDLGSGSDAGGHCPIVTDEIERNFKKTCKVNKKIEKTCGIFTSTVLGPLKDCLASTAGTLTMFNAAAAYEECRLSICAKLPAKKLCHVLKQHVDLCHKQHVEGGKSHPANALWRSATNCKFDKIKKKGDPNGVVACIDPRQRPSCWKPDGCNRLPDIDDSPHECDERMVCNDGHLWNGKKCVESGKC